MIKTLIFIALNRDLQGDDPVPIRCAQGPGLASSAQRMGAAA